MPKRIKEPEEEPEEEEPEEFPEEDPEEVREEKRKEVEDPRDVIIPVPNPYGGSDVVDLRKGRPREEKWSYLIAILIAIIVFTVLAISLVKF